MDSSAHIAWNATHYPGTRQMCCECDEPTERCEEDSIHCGDIGPLCRECSNKYDEDGNLIKLAELGCANNGGDTCTP